MSVTALDIMDGVIAAGYSNGTDYVYINVFYKGHLALWSSEYGYRIKGMGGIHSSKVSCLRVLTSQSL